VVNLIAVSRLRRTAVKAGLSEVVAMGTNLRIAPATLPDSLQVRLQRMYPGAKYFAAASALSVPMPRINGESLADADLVDWTATLLAAIFPAPAPAAVAATE
jgi:transcription-repair coupling factor (superfamily II helicase)